MEFLEGNKMLVENCCRYKLPSHSVRVEDVTTSFQGIFIAREVYFLLKDAWFPKQCGKKGVENACGCFTQDP